MSLLNILPKIEDKNGFPWTEETSIAIYKKDIEYPKITIITPSFNQGQFLEETIRSVLLQNYPNLEYIIIDGGSTDNSIEIIKKYEQWIDYWISEPDEGQAHAINKGLKIATGEIINWLNSDDWYLPNILEIIGYEFKVNPTLNAVSGTSLMIKNYVVTQHFSTNIGRCKEEAIAKLDISQPSTFFRNTIIKNGLISNLHYMFDAALWALFLLTSDAENFKQIAVPVVYYRLHDSSKTVSNFYNFQKDRFVLLKALRICFDLKMNVPQKLEADEIMSLEIIKYWNLSSNFIKLDNEKLKQYIYISYLKQALMVDDFASARQIAPHIWKSCLTEPQLLLKIILLLFSDNINKNIRKIT